MVQYAYKSVKGFYKLQIKVNQIMSFGSYKEPVRAEREIILDTERETWDNKIVRSMGSVVDGFIPQTTVSECLGAVLKKLTTLLTTNQIDRRYQELYVMNHTDAAGLRFSFYIKLV